MTVEQEPSEEVFFQGHPSWRSILGFYIKGVAGAVVAGALAGVITRIAGNSVDVGTVIVVVLIVFAIVLVAGFVRRIETTYTISDQRLTIRTGIFSRSLQETRLVRVQNVNVNQSLIDRLVRVGDVDFDTAGGDDYDFEFRGVGDPHMIVKTVDRALRQAEASGAVTARRPDTGP